MSRQAINSRTPATFRTNLFLGETEGKAATVQVTVVYAEVGKLASEPVTLTATWTSGESPTRITSIIGVTIHVRGTRALAFGWTVLVSPSSNSTTMLSKERLDLSVNWEKDQDLTRSEEYALEEIRELLGERPTLADRLRAELAAGLPLPVTEPRLRVLAVIAEHIEDESFTAAELGSAIGLSRSSLERNCRNFFGMTPGSLIRLVRLEEAARILATTDTDIGQVAYAVGYSGVSQFTRAFRQCYGSSPTAWRERARSSRPR